MIGCQSKPATSTLQLRSARTKTFLDLLGMCSETSNLGLIYAYRKHPKISMIVNIPHP